MNSIGFTIVIVYSVNTYLIVPSIDRMNTQLQDTVYIEGILKLTKLPVRPNGILRVVFTNKLVVQTTVSICSDHILAFLRISQTYSKHFVFWVNNEKCRNG